MELTPEPEWERRVWDFVAGGREGLPEEGKRWQLGGVELFRVEMGFRMRIPEPRLIRVMVGRREGDTRRTKQRWIANDFRAGTHRTREDARRAFWRKVRETGRP